MIPTTTRRTANIPQVAIKKVDPNDCPFAPVWIRSSAVPCIIGGWRSLDDITKFDELQVAISKAIKDAVDHEAAAVLILTPTRPLGGESEFAMATASILRVLTIDPATRSGSLSECDLPVFGLSCADGAANGVLALPKDQAALAGWLSSEGVDVDAAAATARLN